MDTNNIAALATSLQAVKTAQVMDVAVLKKALEVQEQNAAELIRSVPQPNPEVNPPHLGQNVDVFA